MLRYLSPLAVAAVLCTSAVALADDPPPPPPPAPAEGSASSGGSAFRQADALLDASPKSRPLMLSFFAGIPWGYYYGCSYYYGGGCGFPLQLGVRFDIPIVPNGFIPQLNDSFDIEFGADFDMYFGRGVGVGITPVAGVRWNFHLIPRLAVYPKFELGLGIFPGNAYPVRFYGNVLAGVVYNVTDTISLRAELGYYSVKAGIGISF